MLACPRCRSVQPDSAVNTGALHPCPGCAKPIRTDVFRAFYRQNNKISAENVLAQGQAECFEHAGKKAVAACDACGRLLCELCRVELSGRNLCMRCLQIGRDKRRIDTLQQQQTLNDVISLNLAFWPIPTIFLTLITAPAAIFFAVRHWRTPANVLPKRWAGSILAFLLGTGQLVGWAIFFFEKFG